LNDLKSNKPIFRHRGYKYPTVATVIRLHDKILVESEGLSGIRDAGLLESALHKIVEGFGGEDSYPTLFTKAAMVGFSIAQNHVFSDANKRTALETMLLMLELNGYSKCPITQAATTVMVLVATGNLEVAGLRVALLHWCGLNPGDDSL
jgi:death on curing protein